MSGHTHTHDNYYNPRCAHAHRGLIIDIHSTASSFYELQKYLQKTTNIEFTLMNL